MKKHIKLFLLLCLFGYLLFGCSKLSNNPTSKVEELFSKYQMLDKNIKDEITTIIENENLSVDNQERYKNLLETQYKNLSYEIKDEVIDNDTAIVTTQIEVIDYRKVIQQLDNDYNNKEYTLEEYNQEKINRLEKASDKVIYTLELTVNKDNSGIWKLALLSNIDKKKIQGMY